MSVAPTSLTFLPVYDIENLWNSSLVQILNGRTELVIPFQVRDAIGPSGVLDLVTRFSNFINEPASVLEDTMAGAVRVLPPPHYNHIEPCNLSMATTSQESLTTEVAPINHDPTELANTANETSQKTKASAKIAKDRLSKVPRPPNAFILYRQHHHPSVKAKYPNIHNNQISVIIGNKWKNEDAAIKIKFRQLANEMKQKHHLEHPDYQYQPRKPSEKKKRSSKRKVAAAPLEASIPSTLEDLPVDGQPGNAVLEEVSQDQAISTATVPSYDQATTPSEDTVETPPESATTLFVGAPVANMNLAPPIQYVLNGRVHLPDLLHMDDDQLQHFFLPRETLHVDSFGDDIRDHRSPFLFEYPAYAAENREAHEASDDLLANVTHTMFDSGLINFDN